MATLRDPLFRQSAVTPREIDALQASGMSSLRRGYEAGRVTTDLNAALAAEASARASGDLVAAEEAAQAQQRLGLRQQLYTPEVAKVEDINSLGSAGSWAATQMGQGVASMQDPVALAAAGQGVSTAMKAVPGLRGVAAIPALAGAAGAFGLNAEQMKGEFYGNLKEDPVALQRWSPQEANTNANLYGLGAGALDTVLPVVAGRALGGAALRTGTAPGVARGTAGGMVMEGTTELAQGELGRFGVALANPERDTSGDMSARLNEFAGGAVGGAPFSAAGAVADNAFARTANAGEVVTDAAGAVVDLGSEAATKGRAKVGEVIDLGVEKGKSIWDGLQEKGAPAGIAEATQERLRQLRVSADEADVLNAAPPSDLGPDQMDSWIQNNDAQRAKIIGERLFTLAEAGDDRAADLLDATSTDDPVAQVGAMDRAAAYLLEHNEYAHATERAAQFRSGMNDFLRGAGRVAGKAAVTAGQGVASVAKGLAQGAAEGSKKNLQGMATLDYDTWKAWKDENHPTPTSEPGSTHAIQKAVQGRSRLAELRDQTKGKPDPEKVEASKRRASLFAELVAAEAEASRPVVARRVGADGMVDVVNYARSIGFEVADLAESWGGRQGRAQTAREGAQFDVLKAQMDALAGDMRGVLGERAGDVVQRLLAASEPAARPFLEYLGEQIDGWQANTRARNTTKKDLGVQMAALLPTERQQELVSGGGLEQLVDTVTQVARGRVAPGRRAALEQALGGPRVLNQLLQLVGDQTAREALLADTPTTMSEELAITDDGEVDTDAPGAMPDDFETRQAERSVGVGAGAPSYSFARTPLQSSRTPTTQRPDPFAPDPKTSKRPMLFQPALADDTAVGGPALEKKIADVTALHKGAPGAMKTVAKPLAEVFKGLKYSEEQQLALFRDYLRQEQTTPDADKKADIVQAVLDGKYKHVGGVGKIRKALQEFAQSRSVVVTEQGTERAPTELPLGTIVALGKAGDAAMAKMRGDAMQAGPRGSAAYKTALNKAVAEANMMVFQSAEGKNIMGRRTDTDRDIFIPADRLVKWVRSRPQDDGQTRKVKEGETKPAHVAYLEDLLSGIQSVMGSGYAASALPSMIDAEGTAHSFADRLPPHLRLGLRKVSSFQADAPTVAKLEAAREEAALKAITEGDPAPRTIGGDARNNPRYQERVAEEQNRDFFTPQNEGDAQPEKFRTSIERDGKVTYRDQFVPADKNEDDKTPLDATRDERYGNAKTEREDLADRTIKKAADLDLNATKPAAPKVQQANNANITRLMDYLQNPPASYTPERAARISSWAQTEVDRIRGELRGLTDSDKVSDMETLLVDLRVLKRKADELITSDKDAAAANPALFAGSEVPAKAPKAQTAPAGVRNRQRVNDNPAPTDADVAKAKEYLDRVLGPQIKAEFKEVTGYSGEWIDNENLLVVSTLTNVGVLNVARHEAMHAFFSKFVRANPKAVRVLSSLTDDPRVLRRLRALLKDEPAALEQLQDGEERLAYIYQFAMAGQLKLPNTAGASLMGKIRKFLRRVFQMISDQERAVDLLYAFEAGKFREPSAGARALAATLDQGTWLTEGTRQFDGLRQRTAAMVLPANTILAESVSPTARELALKFFTNPGEEAAGHGKEGYLNARNRMMRRYDNLFRNAIDKLDEGQMSVLIEAMQKETPTDALGDQDVVEAKDHLHQLFSRFYRYMADEKGLRIGKINENYFPVVWDPSKVSGPEFQNMLMSKYKKQVGEIAAAYNATLDKGGVPVSAEAIPALLAARMAATEGVLEMPAPSREDGVLRPWFASGERRALNFIAAEDRAPFLEKNLVSTLSRYVRQGVRTAEYSARFGRQGKVLADDLAKAHRELREAGKTMRAEGALKDDKAEADWVRRQYRDISDAVGAMEGTLGKDISHTMRQVNSWGVVYQNVRLLPLALFSSFVDPLGIIARGGEAREAFEAFMGGLKGVARQWKDMIRDMPEDRQKGQWEQLAEHAGVIDGAIFSHLLADEYGSVYLDNKARRINELMFKANGMDAWNRAMRVGATRSAVRFIERHSKLPEKHSARWMAELGLDPADLPMDVDGQLITDKRVLLAENPDMPMADAEATINRVHGAIVRWVEGAVLSPNAAQRPAWGSDPHFSLFWHLKQFAYSFHETLIKRAVNEARHGNVMPLGMFSWYIPTMIASDITKGLMVNGGELPSHMQGYDLGDWVLHGVDRSGVLGVGGLGVDAVGNPLSLGGPMVEQIADIFIEPVNENIVRSLPVNSLYANALL
jgi:hypothetical protein